MIHLICTFEPLRLPLLAQFVEHYQVLGIEKFHLSLQIEPEIKDSAAKAATDVCRRILKPYGVELTAVLRKPFNSLNIRVHHDGIQRELGTGSDWIVWADLDEFQVYPGDFRSLVQVAQGIELDYFHGYLVEKIAGDGKLKPFVASESIWNQYPRRFSLPGADGLQRTHKVACARSDVAISRGNHVPLGDKPLKYYAEDVEIHHFKWDATVVQRLSRRLQPDFQSECPWWVDSRDLIEHIQRNEGRLADPDV